MKIFAKRFSHLTSKRKTQQLCFYFYYLSEANSIDCIIGQLYVCKLEFYKRLNWSFFFVEGFQHLKSRAFTKCQGEEARKGAKRMAPPELRIVDIRQIVHSHIYPEMRNIQESSP